MAHWKVPVWSAQSQNYGLVPGAQWGSFTPNLTPRSHLTLDRLTPDGEGPCIEGLGHSCGLQAEWGLEPIRSSERCSGSFSQEEAQGNTPACVALARVSGAKLQPMHHSQSCAFQHGPVHLEGALLLIHIKALYGLAAAKEP